MAKRVTVKAPMVAKASRSLIRRGKANFPMATREKEKASIQSLVISKDMTQKVMGSGTTIPKERVTAKAKGVVMVAKVANQPSSVGIAGEITKLQIAGRTIMCDKFLMDRIHSNSSSPQTPLLSLSLLSHNKQIPQRPRLQQLQHIV